MVPTNTIYVAVHGGAGHHAVGSEQQVNKALKRACIAAIQAPPASTSLDIVERAIAVLEDEDCLNAGYGSNLTESGTVECDAAIMDGRTQDFGSIGAASHVKNPIKVAKAVLEHSREPDVLGRIRPLHLVSTGAQHFAASKALTIVSAEDMISPRAKAEWAKWKSGLELSSAETPSSVAESVMQDTVGAVAWDNKGDMAAGVSSGGLLLKYPGRVGEAAIFGAGCWAEQSLTSNHGMACSISGAGEHIIRTCLARSIGDALRPPEASPAEIDIDTHEVLHRVITHHFEKATKDRGEHTPNAGVLLLTKEVGSDGAARPRLWCAFTTESMAVAYASSTQPKPKSSILRRPKRSGSTDASSVYITSIPL
ncbi:nucleophile aminohydrolase [Hygrophoropsis aurantiaca]|uniref:Nucleophile aminohydrolase n=1 Tax=Hygrophoropsis aurantiaca TaxID=72124 RepID=A0ACB8AKC0_9AGAM|nr:nucleophile aminohydrolase [Hygrophoropsis aurantiaca]